MAVLDGHVFLYKKNQLLEVTKNDSVTYIASTDDWLLQKRKINVQWNSVKLQSALLELEQVFNLKIFNKTQRNNEIITILANNVSLEELLEIITESMQLSYKIINENEVELY